GPVAGPSSITTPTLESQELRQYLAKENNPVETVAADDSPPEKALEQETIRWMVVLLVVLLGGGLFWRKKSRA
ncbi:MAG: hypothetical protein GXP15_10365, partial [Gammaproteobacteria bacterium]|nr:hypothetical protein [Gammaproteobacteria bacterium]